MKRNKKNEINEKTKEKIMDTLESELLPQNGNIVRAKKIRVKKIKAQTPDETLVIDTKAEVIKFEALDPFNNCNDFYSFYTKAIKMFNSGAKFYDIEYERNIANDILDLLILNNKNHDIMFLKAWIKHFVLTYLNNGTYIFMPEKTSLKVFKSTFTTFKNSYIR